MMRPTCAHCGEHDSARTITRRGRHWHLCEACADDIIGYEVRSHCRVGCVQQSGPGKGCRLPWPQPLATTKHNYGQGHVRAKPDLAMLDKMPAPCRRDWSAQSQWRQRR